MGSAMVCLLSLTVLLCGVILQYKEMRQKLFVVNYMNDMKFNRLPYPLSYSLKKRFLIKFDFYTKYVMKSMYWSAVIASNLVFLVTLIVSYRNGHNIDTIAILFGSQNFIIFVAQAAGILWMAAALWYGISLYLRYKFDDVFQKIQFVLRKSSHKFSSYALMRAIKEHQFLEVMTKNCDDLFSLLTYVIYFIATPAFQIALYGSHYHQSYFVGRLYFAFFCMTCFTATASLNLFSSLINRSAHKPYPVLHSYLSRNGSNLPLEHRMKIALFIECQSRSDIGFHCKDLFLMNSFELFQYFYFSAANYFLIMGLF